MIDALVYQYYFRHCLLSDIYLIHTTFREMVVLSYSGDCADRFVNLRLVATIGIETWTI
jgi:hypothetical protein